MNKLIFAAVFLLFGGIFYHAHAASWFANEMCVNQAGLSSYAADLCTSCIDNNHPNFALEGDRSGATGKISYQELAKTCITCSTFEDIRHATEPYYKCINRCRPVVSPAAGDSLGHATEKQITLPYIIGCANCCKGTAMPEPVGWSNQACPSACQNECENMCGETSDANCVSDCQQTCADDSSWFATTFTKDPHSATVGYARCSGQMATIMATLKQLREKLDDYNDEVNNGNLTIASLRTRLTNITAKSSLVVGALQAAVTQCQNT